ncbi:MAG: hypothetical protein ABR569_10580 [Gaiellaceae bacterium]
MIYGGIEAGATKWVCVIGSGPDDVQESVTFPTTHPDETIARAAQFFAANGNAGRRWDRLIRTDRRPARLPDVGQDHDDAKARLGHRRCGGAS